MTEFYIFGEQSPQSEIKLSFLFRCSHFSIISTPFLFLSKIVYSSSHQMRNTYWGRSCTSNNHLNHPSLTNNISQILPGRLLFIARFSNRVGKRLHHQLWVNCTSIKLDWILLLSIFLSWLFVITCKDEIKLEGLAHRCLKFKARGTGEGGFAGNSILCFTGFLVKAFTESLETTHILIIFLQ